MPLSPKILLVHPITIFPMTKKSKRVGPLALWLIRYPEKLSDDFGIVMTYMDVRFLVDDLNLDLIDEEDEEAADADEHSDADDRAPSPEDSLDDSAGGVQVELDTVTPPGAMASGSVTLMVSTKNGPWINLVASGLPVEKKRTNLQTRM